jgi:hypothetical protein
LLSKYRSCLIKAPLLVTNIDTIKHGSKNDQISPGISGRVISRQSETGYDNSSAKFCTARVQNKRTGLILFLGAIESLPEFLWKNVMKLHEFNIFCDIFARDILISPQYFPEYP